MSINRKRVLLIRQRTANCLYLDTSYALALISAVIEPIADVKILDNNGRYNTYSDREILAFIRSFSPDIIGFNINMFNAFYSYRLVDLIKRHYPEIPLIAGGIHTNHCWDEILELPMIVVKGEGELTFPNLIKKLGETYFQNGKNFDKDIYRELSNVKGIAFRDHRGEIVDTGPADIIHNLDDLPFVIYRKYNLRDFVRKERDNIGSTNIIITQRGCPYSCIFCKSDYFGGKIRETSPTYIVRYIEYLYSTFSFKHIYFADNNFTLNKNRVIEFCKLFIKSGLHKKVSLECQTNILCPLDEEMLSAMIDANFLRIQFGIDRLTESAARKAKIRASNNLLTSKLNLLKSKSMKTFFSILLGMDFDDKASIKAEYEEVKRYRDYAQIISVGVVIPVPGTKLYLRHPDVKRWYLKENFNKKGIHYYDFALTGNSKAIDINLLKLPRDMLRQIIEVQLFGLRNNILNLFGRKGLILFYIDKMLILFSYYLSMVSPKLELIMFGAIKILRVKLIRIAYDLVYYARPARCKDGDS